MPVDGVSIRVRFGTMSEGKAYLDLGMRADTGHDTIDHTTDNLCGILEGLIHAQLDIILAQEHGMTTQQRRRGLTRDSGPRASFREEQRHGLMLERSLDGRSTALLVQVLELHCRSQQSRDFFRGKIGEGEDVRWFLARELCADVGGEADRPRTTLPTSSGSVPVTISVTPLSLTAGSSIPRSLIPSRTLLPLSNRSVIIPRILVETSVAALDRTSLVVLDVIPGSCREVVDCDAPGCDDGLDSSGGDGVPGGRGEEGDGSMHVGCMRCEQKCKKGVKLSVKSYVVVRASNDCPCPVIRSLAWPGCRIQKR